MQLDNLFARSLDTSFSARVSVTVLTFVVLIFLAAFTMFYHFSTKLISADTRKKADMELNICSLEIEGVLRSVEAVPHNLRRMVAGGQIPPDSLYPLAVRIVSDNPTIYGCAIAFEPYYFEEKGTYFSPYAYREGDRVLRKQLGGHSYDYFTWDWYRLCKERDVPLWSDPYYDDGGGQMLMCTYSTPLHDSSGRFAGVLTSDISLDWLSAMINGLNKANGSYAFMISHDGTFIAHPDQRKILSQTIFESDIDTSARQEMARLGESMISGRHGFDTIHDAAGRLFAFYAPVAETNWYLALLIPESEIFAGLRHIRRIVLLISLAGLILLFFFCRWTVRRLTRPIKDFAASARSIASGNFETRLPDIRSKDEMLQLHDALGYMQRELSRYMDNLAQTVSAKERIENELRIAREIQMGMVPKTFPPFPGRFEFDLFAVLHPAREVGGDLYDFVMDGNNLVMVVGDVSGKGVPASLFMAVTRSLLRTIVPGSSPADIVTRLNRSVSEINETSMFVTLFVAVLDIGRGVMRFCSAGHNPPLMLTPGGKCSYLETTTNIPIGIASDFIYRQQQVTLESATALIFYTDGVTEAENDKQELYGQDRLRETVSRCVDLSARQIIECITGDVDSHVGATPPSDDITLMVVDYSGNTSGDKSRQEYSIVIGNSPDQTREALAFFEETCRLCAVPDALQNKLTLAVEEALVNAIGYAYAQGTTGFIELRAGMHDGVLEVRITDRGIPFDPTAHPDPDLSLGLNERPEGGLGIFLVKQIMDRVDYRRKAGCNILKMYKEIT